MADRPLSIGVVANPASGRDLRRVLGWASVFPNAEKVNVVLRLLGALGALGVDEAWMLPDSAGIGARVRDAAALARAQRGQPMPEVRLLDLRLRDRAEDSADAAAAMVARGVRAIAVLGGDGTHRAVVRQLVGGGGGIPVAGLSTGTNNAFPEMREPTITGMAVGLWASGRIAPADALAPNKLVEVHIADPLHGDRRDVAIVDAVVTHDRSVGARALWKTSSLDAAYLAFADPQSIGLSAIGGLLQPVGRRDPGGLAVQMAHDQRHALLALDAPIAPGMVRAVPIASWQRMVADEPMAIAASAGTVALDGERELGFEPGQRVSMTLRENAFLTVDVARCMTVAAEQGLLRNRTRPIPSTTPH